MGVVLNTLRLGVVRTLVAIHRPYHAHTRTHAAFPVLFLCVLAYAPCVPALCLASSATCNVAQVNVLDAPANVAAYFAERAAARAAAEQEREEEGE